MRRLLTILAYTLCIHTCVAQRFIGGVYIHKEAPSSIYIGACESPFRSVDGQRFENLNPLFNWLTNTAALQRATLPPRPMPEWVVVSGKVVSINYERGLIVERGQFMTPGYREDVFHLVNYPGQTKLTDGSEIFGLAKKAGTIQYPTIRAATATVHSFDFGRPPTPEEIAAAAKTNRVKP